MLPRSGGTVVARCLGSMKNVFLLSEVHPRTDPGLTQLDPIWQAQEWFRFFPDRPDAHKAFGGDAFAKKIERVYDEVAARNGILVLRDWSHLDFTGFPHVKDPLGRLSILDALDGRFDILNAALVRHPLPQFASHRALMASGSAERAAFVDKWFTPEFFARAYLFYAQAASDIGCVRYEDFLSDPDGFMKGLCATLAIPFDPGFQDRWRDNDSVTGAVDERTDRIAATPRAPLPPDLEARLRESLDYRKTCALLDYDALSG